MKFLIVDDSSIMRRIIRQTICSDNDEVSECNDGDNALFFYSKNIPDYVLMDIQMNRVDGLTAAQDIIEEYPEANIIIITDYDSPAFRLAAERTGAIGFVSKENLLEIKKYIKNGIEEK